MKVKLVKRDGAKGVSLSLFWIEGTIRKQKSTGLVLLKENSKEIKELNKKTYQCAEKMRLALELELAEGKVQVSSPLLLDYWGTVQERRKVNGIARATCRMWNQANVYLTRYLTDRRKLEIKLNQIDIDFVEDYKIFLKNTHLSIRSVNLYLEKFGAVLRTAVKEGYVKANVGECVTKLKENKKSVVYLTSEEVQKLFDIDYPSKMEVCLGARFSLLTGLRISDVANLRWSNVKNGVMEIVTVKTHTRLRLPLTDKMKCVLNTARELWNDPDGRVFGPLRAKSYDKSFKSWQKRCGIEKKLRWHRFRDTAANLMIQSGVDIFTVSKILTHSSVRVTQDAYVTDATDKMFGDALSKL